MHTTIGEILAAKRIIVCVGSGGVGKTTTAAALALATARTGRKTLVLTIDPARRLANSLGLAELGHQVSVVPPALIDGTGRVAPGGSLHAMMLDQKRAFDEVVASHASDPEAVKRILANPVYAQVSGSLAGSQEYAAMAKLQEFHSTGEWDLIVVDTPPTAHALDFLDAPQKLSMAIDSPAIEWFRKLRGGGSGGWSLIGKTGSYILKRLTKFVGKQFLEDLSVFFTEFNDILGGFRTRAEETFALLRDDSVAFVLVASPEPMATNEALYFYQRLVSSAMPFGAFVVNKVHTSSPTEFDIKSLVAALAEEPAVTALGFQPTTLRIAGEALLANHNQIEAIAAADSLALARLRKAGGEKAILVSVPLLSEDVHDIQRLAALGAHLVG